MWRTHRSFVFEFKYRCWSLWTIVESISLVLQFQSSFLRFFIWSVVWVLLWSIYAEFPKIRIKCLICVISFFCILINWRNRSLVRFFHIFQFSWLWNASINNVINVAVFVCRLKIIRGKSPFTVYNEFILMNAWS